MFVELIESLRCPRAHADSALVAAVSRSEQRYIVEGTLGCPVCGAQFPIANGIARFDDDVALPSADTPSAETAMRLAAFLELTDARGFVLLAGRWTVHADEVRRIAETPLVLVNAPKGIRADAAAMIEARDAVPLAPSSARSCALDSGMSPSLVTSLVRIVRAAGRILGPVALSVPAGVRELVRDDHVWVAEKTAAPDQAPRLLRLERPAR